MNRRRTEIAKRAGDAAGANGIRAMAVGMSLLTTMAEQDGPVSLGRAATAAGLTPSRTHRYLASLIHFGFVVQDASTGLYDLGPAAVELGLAAVSRLDPIRVGSDSLVELSHAIGVDSHLAIWGNRGPTVVRWESGQHGYAVKIREGRVLTLLGTATGRLFLAYLDASRTETFLEQEIKQWNSTKDQKQPITSAAIERIQADTRRYGIAGSIETNRAGVQSFTTPLFNRPDKGGIGTLAAPVFDTNGICMTLTLLGLTGTFDLDLAGEPARQLKRVAANTSKRLGAASRFATAYA